MAIETVQIKGAAELYKNMSALPAKIEKNLLRGALRAGGKEYAAEAKARVPVRSGDLRDSIRVSVRALRGRVVAAVKAGGGKKAVHYAIMVEKGTAPHVIIAGGGTMAGKVLAAGARIFGAKVDHPGAVAKPFMRPAFDTKSGDALDAVTAYLRKRIEKLAAQK